MLLDGVTRTDRQFVRAIGQKAVDDSILASSCQTLSFRPWPADRACDRICPIESETEAAQDGHECVHVSVCVLGSRHNQSTRLTPCPLCCAFVKIEKNSLYWWVDSAILGSLPGQLLRRLNRRYSHPGSGWQM